MINNIKPFLKWPGSKFKPAYNITKHFTPCSGQTVLVEPFLGSASIFLNTNYKNYYLTDNNPDLVNLYLYLIKEGEKFIKYCSKYYIDNNNNADIYYELRDQFNNTKSQRKKSALFLYLNKHGFNGLCRYNNSGRYNVPFGRYKRVNIPKNEMLAFYNKAQTVNLKLDCLDYKECFELIKAKSDPNYLVYCDPPYVPLSKTSSFTKYSISDFSLDDQYYLVEFARELKNINIDCYISNHDLEITRKLYHDAKIISFKVKRSISRDVNSRTYIKELLAIYDSRNL